MAAGSGYIRPGHVWYMGGYGKAAGRACPAPTGRRNCLKRLVGSGLDRSGKVAGDGNRTRRHIYIPRNYAAAAQLRGGVKTPPYRTDDLRQPIITPAAYIFLSIPTKYEQNKCPAAFWGSRAVLYIIGNTAQFPPYGLSTAPAAAARHLRCQNARQDIQYYLRFWLSICRTSLAVSALRIMRYCPK